MLEKGKPLSDTKQELSSEVLSRDLLKSVTEYCTWLMGLSAMSITKAVNTLPDMQLAI